MYTKVIFQTKDPKGKVSRNSLEISTDHSNLLFATVVPLAQGVGFIVDNESPCLNLLSLQETENYNPKVKTTVSLNGEGCDFPQKDSDYYYLQETDIIVVTSTIDGQVTTTTVVVTQIAEEDDFDEED